jgi:alpha-glucan, water dikinase
VPRAVAASPPSKVSEVELERSSRTVAGGTVTLISAKLPDGSTTVTIDTSQVPDRHGLVLHWGTSPSARRPHEWGAPPDVARPTGSALFGDGLAVRTPIPPDTPLVISFPADTTAGDGAPATLVGIVVRVGRGEDEWLHAEDGLGDLEAPVRAPPPPPPPAERALTLSRRVAEHEAKGGMNLFARYCLVNETLGEAMADPAPGSAAVILAWLRLSASRQLPWYDGGNYQGKDMAHMQKTLASSMATHCHGDGLKARHSCSFQQFISLLAGLCVASDVP